jgi:hypothetical protein
MASAALQGAGKCQVIVPGPWPLFFDSWADPWPTDGGSSRVVRHAISVSLCTRFGSFTGPRRWRRTA